MTHDEFVSHVAGRAGLPAPRDAERVARTVLEVLRERLSWPVLQALSEDLPSPLAASFRGEHGQTFDVAEFHARVARRAQVRLGVAVESIDVVCQVLAETLSSGTLYRLGESLPDEWRPLFVPREPDEPLEHVHLDPARRTLAEGRPGSSHPLSEARPERAHTQSVARADNPHGETKLSSASGLTQEREEETLALGHPGSDRPLSEGH